MRLIPYSIGSLALVVPAGNPLHIGKAGDLGRRAVGVEAGGIE